MADDDFDDLPPDLVPSNSGELSWPALIVGIVLSLAAVGAVFYFISGVTKVDASATGRIAGADFTVEAERCTIGISDEIKAVQIHRLPLDGVKIVGRAGGSVFVHRDGGYIIVEPPACEDPGCELRLEADNCETFDVEIGWTGAVHNNHDLWAGHARVTCDIDGSAVKGHLEFPTCG